MNNRVNFATATGTSTFYLEPENTPVTTTGAPVIAGNIKAERRKKPRDVQPTMNVESAVYSYIQAVRALGKTRLTASEIASSLSISPFDVNEAIAKLHSKGVKIISG